MALPSFTGLLLVAVTAVGGVHVDTVGVTTTTTVAVAVHVPLDKTVTVYVPAIAIVADEMVGFCVVDTKLFGPLQL